MILDTNRQVSLCCCLLLEEEGRERTGRDAHGLDTKAIEAATGGLSHLATPSFAKATPPTTSGGDGWLQGCLWVVSGAGLLLGDGWMDERERSCPAKRVCG